MRNLFNSKTLILFCLLSIGSAACLYSQKPKPTYFEKHRSLADSLSIEYGIPVGVILSVAYLESGAGTSLAAKKLNNHFGIVGDCKYPVSNHKSKYKYYPTVEESYVAFCNLVKNRRFYESLRGSTEERVWFIKIAATGYAADATKWSNACIRICKDNL